MKNFYSIGLISCLILLISCGQKPEERVKEFALKFGDFVNTNQKDSIKKYYPQFQITDSLSGIAVSNVTVNPGNAEGIYIAEFSPETFITVSVDNEGMVNVVESKNILAFPSTLIEILKNDAKWDDAFIDSKRKALVDDYMQKEKEKELANRLTIQDFCIWNSNEKVMEMKSDKKVIERLEKLGYACEKKWSEYEEYCGEEPIKVEMYDYKRDLYGYVMKIEIRPLSITIEFPNEELLANFIETALSNRFKKAPASYEDYLTYVGPNFQECYWNGTDIQVSGNTVTLISRFEC